ncbi:hypothetical protein AQJ67_09990 [Streptomyces caeruleatus]|uniref:2'-5' RNA ligase n=2 Tax=Streptomyces caeruleatus TaxID=661399 RepID=A0A124IA81_9ACTN|nr:hypothetical protein AQJ67_09990 [Streptomyces caeruleatus]
MNDKRLWVPEDGPGEDRVRPHVLWLPQDQPQVMAYFARIREILGRYPDIITPVADKDIHGTLQKINYEDSEGKRVGEQRLHRAGPALQDALAGQAPIDIEIGPPRASASAAVVDLWPETVLHELHLRIRDGLMAASLTLPAPAEFFWGHATGGYGLKDTDTPELAERSDLLASELGRGLRPGSRIPATISSVWLVLERQDPVANRYTFTRVHEIHLGRNDLELQA